MLPEKVDLTYDQIQNLKTGIHDSNLSNEDKALIKGLIDFNSWLQQPLENDFFDEYPQGHVPQSKGKNKKPNSNTIRTPVSTDSSNDEIITDNANQDVKPITTNNGRLSHQQYLNSEKVTIKHQKYKSGDLCPTECGGRHWNATPGTVIKISG